KPFWLRATALFGLAQRKDLPVGRTASLRNIQKLPGKVLLHCCKMPKERFGLGSGTPADCAPSDSLRPRVTEPGVSAGPYLPCTRTTKAICGSRHKPVCGGGRLVLRSTFGCPMAQLRPGH